MRKTDRQAAYEQIIALPLDVRVRAAIALIDHPKLRKLLEPVLESVARDLELDGGAVAVPHAEEEDPSR